MEDDVSVLVKSGPGVSIAAGNESAVRADASGRSVELADAKAWVDPEDDAAATVSKQAANVVASPLMAAHIYTVTPS